MSAVVERTTVGFSCSIDSAKEIERLVHDSKIADRLKKNGQYLNMSKMLRLAVIKFFKSSETIPADFFNAIDSDDQFRKELREL